MQLEIKQITRSEIELISSLWKEYHTNHVAKYDPTISKSWGDTEECFLYYKYMLKNPLAICLVIILNTSTAIGMIFANPETNKERYRIEGSDIFYISDFYIQEEYQNQGFGRLLIDELTKLIKERGGKQLVLSVFSENPAVGFYKKFGFTEFSKDMSLYL